MNSKCSNGRCLVQFLTMFIFWEFHNHGIKLCLDAGNDEYVIVCNSDGLIIYSFIHSFIYLFHFIILSQSDCSN